MRKLSLENKEAAVEILKKGGILGVPTETVYGLAVKSDNKIAIQKLLDLKDRQIGSGKILTIMVADLKDMQKYAELTKETTNTARHYFPGELTMILPRAKSLKHCYFDNFKTIGIRIPKHQYMLDLLKQSGPLLVTSANPRGEAPCRRSEELSVRLPKVDAVVEGVAGGNLPSTIIDFTQKEPRVLRQGGLLVVHY